MNLLRLARLTAAAVEAFGDRERARQWLISSNPVFDDEAPAAGAAHEYPVLDEVNIDK